MDNHQPLSEFTKSLRTDQNYNQKLSCCRKNNVNCTRNYWDYFIVCRSLRACLEEVPLTSKTKNVTTNINSSPNNKILGWSKLKAFADDKIHMTEKLKFVLERVENIVGKGENAGKQHFLLFPQYF